MADATFTSARPTDPDREALLTALRSTVDPTIGLRSRVAGEPFVLKKNTDWTPAHQAAAQGVIDTAPAASAALTVQQEAERQLDAERLASAIVWAILQQIAPPATPAKYLVARDRIVAAYQTQPWKA